MNVVSKIAALVGFTIPIGILAFNFDLNQITIVFWPAMLGLLGLGGKISSFGSYVYIFFLILVNGIFYYLLAQLAIFLLSLIKPKQ